MNGDCCKGTGLADYAAVPCPNPECPVAVGRAGSDDTGRHTTEFEVFAATYEESRSYSWGYTDGFDAALALPADHPLIEGIKEKLRAEGWQEP